MAMATPTSPSIDPQPAGGNVYGQATTTQFGEPGDVPVPQTPQLSDLVNGDYDGDRATNLATFSNSTGRWRVRNRADVVYGDASDIAVPADYDGDAVMDIAVWRASTATWYVRDQFTVSSASPATCQCLATTAVRVSRTLPCTSLQRASGTCAINSRSSSANRETFRCPRTTTAMALRTSRSTGR